MKTKPFDPADYLATEEGIDAYLADARDFGPQAHADAVAVVARARERMTEGKPPRDRSATALNRRRAS